MAGEPISVAIVLAPCRTGQVRLKWWAVELCCPKIRLCQRRRSRSPEQATMPCYSVRQR